MSNGWCGRGHCRTLASLPIGHLPGFIRLTPKFPAGGTGRGRPRAAVALASGVCVWEHKWSPDLNISYIVPCAQSFTSLAYLRALRSKFLNGTLYSQRRLSERL